MKVYVNKNTGVEVRSPFVIAGDDWREVTPADPPVLTKPEEKPAEKKAVKKSGNTIRNQK